MAKQLSITIGNTALPDNPVKNTGRKKRENVGTGAHRIGHVEAKNGNCKALPPEGEARRTSAPLLAETLFETTARNIHMR